MFIKKKKKLQTKQHTRDRQEINISAQKSNS